MEMWNINTNAARNFGGLDQLTYECSCGVVVNRPMNMGIPDGWAIRYNPGGTQNIICGDCESSRCSGDYSSVAPVTNLAKKQQSRLLSGVLIDLANPDYSAVAIHDIAAGLANECRFAGQIEGFYSVAQHCVIGSMIADDDTKLDFLMHDAAEAVIKDIAKPLKNLLPDYRKIERLHEIAIWKRFNVEMKHPDKVKRIDNIMLAAENFAIRDMPKCEAYIALTFGELSDADHAVALIHDTRHISDWKLKFTEKFYDLVHLVQAGLT